MNAYPGRKSLLVFSLGVFLCFTLMIFDYSYVKNTPSDFSGVINEVKSLRLEISKINMKNHEQSLQKDHTKNVSSTSNQQTNINVTAEIWKKLRKPQHRRSVRESVDKHYSQANQDQTVYEIFPREEGFFIEMGAFDGKELSNTLWLERKHNWTGLLIEGNPRSCRKIDQLQRQTWRLCACVSREKTASFILSEGVGGVEKNMAKSHVVHLKGNKRVRIPCFHLYDVLQIVGVFHVNYFSLDVEGAEMDVLRSMREDLVSKRIVVDVWTIEYRAWAGRTFDWQKGKENLANLRAFFKEIGGYVEHSQLAYERKPLPDGRYLDVVFVFIETWCKGHKFLPGGKIKC